MSFEIVRVTPSAAVATNGTVSVAYPANRDAGFFAAIGHKAWADGLQALLELNTGFTLTFGTSDITFTYKGTTSIPAGTEIAIQLNTLGVDSGVSKNASPALPRTANIALLRLNLGAPDTADADGISASQSVTVATTPLALINGALASGGVATFDVPRNVVAAWTGTAVLTITGTDEYGAVVKESSASGTSLTGKKAFKTITSASFSADVTSATIGSGDVLGLPVFIEGAGAALAELQDGAKATAGTPLGGVSTVATATTGDVRGTYDPNAACDGAKKFTLLVMVDNTAYKGVSQFAG